MAIAYLYRRGARYHFRRRFYLRDHISRPISITLNTADHIQARRLVARLSVKWDEIVMATGETVKRGYMTASEAVAVFKHGLEEELGLATAGRFDYCSQYPHTERTSRILEAAYRIAARLGPGAQSVMPELLEAYTIGFAEADRHAVVLMIKTLAPHNSARADALETLVSIGAPINAAINRDARVQILLGKAEAQARAIFMNHPSTLLAGDPLS